MAKNSIGREVPDAIDPAEWSPSWFFPAIVSVRLGGNEASRWLRPPTTIRDLTVASWGGDGQAVSDAEKQLSRLGYERVK